MEKKKPQNARDNKQLAYQCFVERGLPQVEVCEFLNIAASQMSKWVKDSGWKILQEANYATISSIKKSTLQSMADIYKQIKEEKRTATAKEVDMILKLASTKEKMDSKADLSHYTEVVENFCKYLKDIPDAEEWVENAYNATLDFVSKMGKEFS